MSVDLIGEKNQVILEYPIYRHLPIQPVVTCLFRESALRESVLSSVFCVRWVIIRMEIKMKSIVLLSSNLLRVVDRSNLSPRRFTDKLNRSMTFGKLLDNNPPLFILIS